MFLAPKQNETYTELRPLAGPACLMRLARLPRRDNSREVKIRFASRSDPRQTAALACYAGRIARLERRS